MDARLSAWLGSRRGHGAAYACVAALLLSVNNVLLPIVYRAGGDPQSVLVLRYGTIALLAAGTLLVSRTVLRMRRQDLFAGLASGAIFALATLALLSSFARIPVSLAILTLYTFPILTVLLNALLSGQRPGWVQIACFVACLAGLALALKIDAFALDPIGLALASLGAIGTAAAFVVNDRVLKHVDSNASSFLMAMSGTVIMAIVLMFGGKIGLPDAKNALGWFALAVSLVCFSTAFIAIFRGVNFAGAARTAIRWNLEPIFTMGLAAVILSEALTSRKLTGAAIVVSAVLLSQIAAHIRPVDRPVSRASGD